jgi:hypothetical protein
VAVDDGLDVGRYQVPAVGPDTLRAITEHKQNMSFGRPTSTTADAFRPTVRLGGPEASAPFFVRDIVERPRSCQRLSL